MARISLKKSDLQGGPGTDLLELCQTVTEDGSLSDVEIDLLHKWLIENRSTDLLAIDVLTPLVESIIRDGKVTKAERTELHRTLEKVLPPELRAVSVAKRRIADAEAREAVKAAKALEKEQRAAERLLNAPIGGANFMVAGVRYEGRDQVISRYARVGDTVFLVRDPGNQYSRHAIQVRLTNDMQIGFVPEDDATDLALLLDEGALQKAIITKILTGGRSPIPVVDVDLYDQAAQIPDAVAQTTVSEAVASHVEKPELPKPRQRSSSRWILWILIAVAVVFIFLTSR